MDRFMRRALALARKADPFPNPRVGAVLVKGGKIIGEGYHRKAGSGHAEIAALADARKRGGAGAANGATMYVTLEPCSHTNKRTPPCVPAIIEGGIKKVVFAMEDPNPLVHGSDELKRAGLEVVGPTDSWKAREMNREYIGSIGKPFVAIKMAMSADGKTATRTGDSKWISGEEERRYVMRMRSDFDAVMVGANTVRIDDPRLTARVEGGKNPIRIVVDGKLGIPKRSGVLQNPDGKTIIATCEGAGKERIKEYATETEAHVFVSGKKEVDLRALCEGLHRIGIRKVLIEGGSELNAKALEYGIVDRLYLCVSPKIIGGRDAKSVIGGRGIGKVRDAIKLGNLRMKRLGPDLLLQYDIIR